MKSEKPANHDGILIVIPARHGSTRFPAKALADLKGKPLIVRVAENASLVRGVDRLIVATDDRRIEDAVAAAGFEAILTGEHATGTDRVGEVARSEGAGLVVNLQGDEPLIDPASVEALIAVMLEDAAVDIGTCGHPFAAAADWENPNVVKVVTDVRGQALYFSRAAIPGTFPGKGRAGMAEALRHVGIYAFRRKALLRFLELERSPLEMTEGLEQLRALENGMTIKVVPIGSLPIGVDTPEDLDEVRRIWKEVRGA